MGNHDSNKTKKNTLITLLKITCILTLFFTLPQASLLDQVVENRSLETEQVKNDRTSDNVAEALVISIFSRMTIDVVFTFNNTLTKGVL